MTPSSFTDICQDVYLFIYCRSSMSSAHAIVQQLFRTGQPTAVGIGYFLKALLDFAMPSGIIVEHKNKEGATRVMMFGRQRLSTSFDVSLGNVVVACFRSLTRIVNRLLWTLSKKILGSEDTPIRTSPSLGYCFTTGMGLYRKRPCRYPRNRGLISWGTSTRFSSVHHDRASDSVVWSVSMSMSLYLPLKERCWDVCRFEQHSLFASVSHQTTFFFVVIYKTFPSQ